MGDKAFKAASDLAKRAAKNEDAQRAAAAAAAWVGKKAGAAATARRWNRRRAYALARQMGGRYSDGTIIANRERIVVWKDGKAVDCFPPLSTDELNGQKLSERPELQGFPERMLKDPPPPKGES